MTKFRFILMVLAATNALICGQTEESETENRSPLAIFHLEQIKQKFMDTLRISKPPENLEVPSELDEYLGRLPLSFSKLRHGRGRKNHGRVADVFIYAYRIGENSLFFPLPSRAEQEIEKATLWMYDNSSNNPHIDLSYIQVNMTLFYHSNSSSNSSDLLVLGRQHSGGWTALPISKFFLKSITPNPGDVLEIQLPEPCVFYGINHLQPPFLLLTMKDRLHYTRTRRSQPRECGQDENGLSDGLPSTDAMSCCGMKVTVSVSDLGWSKWILLPKVFHTRLCLGQCADDSVGLVSHKSSYIKPCCVPKERVPLPVVLYAGDGAINSTIIPDLIVEECVCIGGFY